MPTAPIPWYFTVMTILGHFRPFLLALFIFPIIFSLVIRNKNWRIIVLLVGLTVLGYLFITEFLSIFSFSTLRFTL